MNQNTAFHTSATRQKLSTFALLFFLLILGVATFLVIQPYVFTFILALVFVLLFEPLYLAINKVVRKPYLASGLTTLAITLLIVIPVIIIGITAFVQASSVLSHLQSSFIDTNNDYFKVVRVYATSIPDNLELIKTFILNNEGTIVEISLSTVKAISGTVGSNILPWIGNSIQQILNLIVFLATLVYLFPTKNKFFSALADLNPMGPSRHGKFVKRFQAVTKATMTSLLVVAVVQGFLGWMIYAAIGLPFSVLLGVLQALVSFIPLGSGVLWLPIGIGLIVTGSWIQGLIVLGWGAFVISTVDNIIRPLLLKDGEAGLPEIVTMLSALGGVALFGFWGFLFGPLIASLFLTALELYKEHQNQL